MFEFSPIPKWILLNPEAVALLVIGFGVFGGLLTEQNFGSNFFERFGALTAGVGALLFGLVSSELLNRSQDGYYARTEDDPSSPFAASNIRRTLSIQSFVVLFGTIQWGFGSLALSFRGAA